MPRTTIVALVAASAAALAACGSGTGGGAASVRPETAKQRIERAAHVRLAPQDVPGEAREQGLAASYSNAPTAVEDGQVVALFVMRDADVAGEVSDMVRASAPKSAELMVNDEVMVVYAAAGEDRAASVKRAVDAL
jgi:hypothetical protein